MAYDKKQFSDLISRVLFRMGKHVPKMDSKPALILLLGTAAVESDFGTFFQQIGGGPGKGPFQMEPKTEESIWADLIGTHRQYKKELQACLMDLCAATGPQPKERMETDLVYSIVMARLKYFWAPAALPDAHNITLQGLYWKRFYNTMLGDGTVEKYLKKYRHFVEPRNV